MGNNKFNSYEVVDIDMIGKEPYSSNGPSKTGIYEYALSETVSELFESVVRRSNMEPLSLCFAELPDRRPENDDTPGTKKKRTKDDYLNEVRALVEKFVVGHVGFPMMHACAAEMYAIRGEDGTHKFYYTDGIYGFSVKIPVPKKGHPDKLEVTDLVQGKKNAA